MYALDCEPSPGWARCCSACRINLKITISECNDKTFSGGANLRILL